MATSKISPNADEIVCEIQIAAKPERVFQAIVDPAQVLKWWGRAGMYRCTEFQSDLRPGGRWRSTGEGMNNTPFEVSGEYVEVDPPRLLVQTWIASWAGNVQTTVRWELEANGEGTLVRIRHSGFAAHPELAQSFRGWPQILSWLQALLERGETIEDRRVTN